MTIAELRRTITKGLQEAGSDEATAVAKCLLCDTLGLTMTGLIIDGENEIDEDRLNLIKERYNRLLEGEPLQYVTGIAMFRGLIINIEQGALIPRPETEELVEWALSEMPAEQTGVADICTGSGCIALAVKKERPDSKVWACDISDEALRIAKHNAERLEAEIDFCKMDVLSERAELPQGIKIVISNPPYIRQSERAEMKKTVTDYEPPEALFVSDEDPLIFYRRIADMCKGRDISVYFEINEVFGDEVCEMLKQIGYENIELRKDFTGRDRMVRGTTSRQARLAKLRQP